MTKLKVAVMMGGESSEREVSLNTGSEMLHQLDRQKYEVMGFDLPNELSKIDGFKPDIALLALHGKSGEDGAIQGYLETKGIKYTGSGVLASAIGMNKLLFRAIMEKYGWPMAPLTDKVPCVVKPVDGGSSVGVTIVKRKLDLLNAIKEARKYSSEALVEKYVDGVEYTCGIIGNGQPMALPVVEIRPKNQFFDYEAKYIDGMAEEICPAPISEGLSKKISELSVAIYKAIRARGYARVDLIVKNNKIYILEINTLPGMTKNSLLPKEARAIGMSYSQLLDKIIELGME